MSECAVSAGLRAWAYYIHAVIMQRSLRVRMCVYTTLKVKMLSIKTVQMLYKTDSTREDSKYRGCRFNLCITVWYVSSSHCVLLLLLLLGSSGNTEAPVVSMLVFQLQSCCERVELAVSCASLLCNTDAPSCLTLRWSPRQTRAPGGLSITG